LAGASSAAGISGLARLFGRQLPHSIKIRLVQVRRAFALLLQPIVDLFGQHHADCVNSLVPSQPLQPESYQSLDHHLRAERQLVLDDRVECRVQCRPRKANSLMAMVRFDGRYSIGLPGGKPPVCRWATPGSYSIIGSDPFPSG